MPLYDYRCADCGAEFETIASRDESEPVECEKCGGSHTQRLASTFSCCSTGGTDSHVHAPGGC